MHINVSRTNIRALVITTLLLIMMYTSILHFSFLNYLDELITLFAICVLIARNRITKFNFQWIILLLTFIFVGFISSLFSGLKIVWTGLFIDIFSFLKWPLVYLLLNTVVDDNLKEQSVRKIALVGKIVIPIALIFGLVNLVHDIGMTFDVRHGFPAFKFIFNNPAALNETNLVYFCCIERTSGNYTKKLYFVFFATCTLLTMRSTGLGTLAVYIILGLYLKIGKRIKLRHLIISALAAVGVAASQIQRYILSEHVRSDMLEYGIQLAEEKFPFGYGFAKFGSDQAFKQYSEIYQRYNFNMERFQTFSNDNFWPMLLGQTGVLGTVLYFIMLISVLMFILKNRKSKNTILLMVMLWTAMFISSTGNAMYTSVGSVILFSIISLIDYDEKVE